MGVLWVGAALVFFGWITGIYSVTVPSGPHSYILVGPALDILGLVIILVGALSIHQTLSFVPESYQPMERAPSGVRAPDRP